MRSTPEQWRRRWKPARSNAPHHAVWYVIEDHIDSKGLDPGSKAYVNKTVQSNVIIIAKTIVAWEHIPTAKAEHKDSPIPIKALKDCSKQSINPEIQKTLQLLDLKSLPDYYVEHFLCWNSKEIKVNTDNGGWTPPIQWTTPIELMALDVGKTLVGTNTTATHSVVMLAIKDRIASYFDTFSMDMSIPPPPFPGKERFSLVAEAVTLVITKALAKPEIKLVQVQNSWIKISIKSCFLTTDSIVSHSQAVDSLMNYITAMREGPPPNRGPKYFSFGQNPRKYSAQPQLKEQRRRPKSIALTQACEKQLKGADTKATRVAMISTPIAVTKLLIRVHDLISNLRHTLTVKTAKLGLLGAQPSLEGVESRNSTSKSGY